MVELLGQVAQRALEVGEVDDHVLVRALGLQILLRQIGDDAPAMPVQVLAFAMVVGQEMSGIEAALGFEPVHESSLLERKRCRWGNREPDASRRRSMRAQAKPAGCERRDLVLFIDRRFSNCLSVVGASIARAFAEREGACARPPNYRIASTSRTRSSQLCATSVGSSAARRSSSNMPQVTAAVAHPAAAPACKSKGASPT